MFRVIVVSKTIETISMELFRQKKPWKVMKSAILPHLMEVITLIFFAYNNQILAGMFKRICLDSINPNNELKNSVFPLTKSNCFLDILIFQVLSIDKWLIYNDKTRGRYPSGGKTMAAVSSVCLSLYLDWLWVLPNIFDQTILGKQCRSRAYIVWSGFTLFSTHSAVFTCITSMIRS